MAAVESPEPRKTAALGRLPGVVRGYGFVYEVRGDEASLRACSLGLEERWRRPPTGSSGAGGGAPWQGHLEQPGRRGRAAVISQ
ncbi:hypothetical protein BRADI_2g23882v3 [Brachypodium distachyon]|uniref:Uncharacterized protein n=1 Tax=Brachypodium distachyon TaxID=15368 RepID=A0A2K2DA52_BRADI|nr:hypothetical protein BRADI_2g23882v3 [Brachypodium distachyon]